MRLLQARLTLWSGVVLLLSFLTHQVNGQQVYTLRECLSVALERNLDLRDARLQRQQAALNYRQSKFDRLPDLNLGANQGFNFGRSIDPFTNQFISQQIRSNSFFLSGSAVLFRGGQISSNISRLSHENTASEHQLQRASNDVQLAVVQAYLRVLATQTLSRVANIRVQTQAEQARQARARVRAQTQAEFFALEQESQLALEEQRATQAINDYEQARLQLGQLMMLEDPLNITADSSQTPTVDPTEAVPPLDLLVRTATEQMPEIRAAREQERAAQFAYRISRGGLLPTLTVNGNVATGYSSARTRLVRPVAGSGGGGPITILQLQTLQGDTISIPSSVFESTTRGPQVEKYAFVDQLTDNLSQAVSVNLNIPIFARNTQRTNIATADVTQRRAALAVDRATNTLVREIETARQSARNAQATYQAAERRLAATRATLAATRARVNSGAAGPIDLTLQLNQEFAAQADLINASFQLVFQYKLLDFYQGKPLDTL